jgi:paraquat-inducible protein A
MTAALPAPLDQLIACPHCDALHRVEQPQPGHRALCRRCRSVLIAPRANAYLHILMLAVTVMILMIGAIFFPFLQVSIAGLRSEASIFDAVRAFATAGTAPLTIAVAALIVLIPIGRVLLIVYVLAPLVMGLRPGRHAESAFLLSEDLRPWSMAEIFIIGVAVALVKVADLAQVFIGPAFWMFAALVVVTILQDTLIDRWSIWRTLEEAR